MPYRDARPAIEAAVRDEAEVLAIYESTRRRRRRSTAIAVALLILLPALVVCAGTVLGRQRIPYVECHTVTMEYEEERYVDFTGYEQTVNRPPASWQSCRWK